MRKSSRLFLLLLSVLRVRQECREKKRSFAISRLMPFTFKRRTLRQAKLRTRDFAYDVFADPSMPVYPQLCIDGAASVFIGGCFFEINRKSR